MFPSSYSIVDPLVAKALTPVGAPLWQGPVNGNSQMLQMDADGLGARSTGLGVGAGSALTVQCATFRAAVVTLAKMPSATEIATIGALFPLDGSGGVLAAHYNRGNSQVIIDSGLTSAGAVVAQSDGDSFACTYDPATDTAAVWFKAVGTSLWVQKASITAGYAPLPAFKGTQGWYPWIECDNATVRIANFGVDIMPGALAATPVGPQVEHGRGAC